MTMLSRFLPRCLLYLVISCSCVYAQAENKSAPVEEEKGTVTIVLAGSGPMVVDEVTERNDGYWYKRGNMTTFLDRARVVRIEYPKLAGDDAAPERTESNGRWHLPPRDFRSQHPTAG